MAKKIILSLLLLPLLLPFKLQAATLGVQALSAKVAPGQNFTIRVSVNTQGKTINNAEATVRFPPDLVSVVSVSSGGIFSLWVEPPSFSNSGGTISFNGGVPNPGFTGSGQIMTATFKAKKAGTATFSLAGAAVRENDGLGTNILSGQGSGSILIVEEQKPGPEKPVEKEEPEGPTVLPAVTITSPTHPDSNQWYKETAASFTWRLPAGVSATQTSFDQNPNAVPSVTRRPGISSSNVDVPTNGIWYFHIRYQSQQTWSRTATYKIQVDRTAPENVETTPVVSAEGTHLRLKATDKDSGLAYYTVVIDSQLPVTVPATGEETNYLLPPVAVGLHNITVAVFDKAGNTISKVIQYETQEAEQIIFTKYQKEIKEDERIQVFGLAPSSSTIRISLAAEDGLIRYYYVTSGPDGKFVFTSEPIAGGGTYTLWAEIEAKDGQKAMTSERLEIMVKESLVSKTRSLMSSLRALLTIGNFLTLLFFLLALVGWYKYYMLKKGFHRFRK